PAPVGSPADSPRRAAVPIAPNLPSMRGTSRYSRLRCRASSISAFCSSPSTARLTDMCGRTTTSSMGRTGRSSDLGVVAIFSKERLPSPRHSQSWRAPSPASGRYLPMNGEDGPRLDPGYAPRGAAAPGHRVDDDRGQQHEPGHDVLPLKRKPKQVHTVVDGADHESAQHAVERLAAASHEAGPPDDRGGDRVQDVVARLQVVG